MQLQTVPSAVKMVVTHGVAGVPIVTSKGKVVGSKLTFAGALSAAELRKSLKAAGVKGKKLTAEVNAVLTGAKDVAWAKHDAATSLLRSGGYIPDCVEARKGGATARFVRPADAEVAVVSREAALAALGLTEDKLKALI